MYETPPYYSSDTLQLIQTSIINDTVYFEQNKSELNPHGLSKYLRKDSVGNVFGRMAGRDQMIYNINASVGSSWEAEVQQFDRTISYTITLIADSEEVVTNAGIFNNCLKYLIQTFDLTEATYYVWLAPSIGEVKRDGWGLAINFSLKKAVLNGNSISPHVFQLFSIHPLSGMDNVDVSTNITFFLNTIPSQSFTDSNISVISHKEGPIEGIWSKDWAFIFTPAHSLPELDTITITLSARITDWFSDSLDGNYNWKYDGMPEDNFQWMFYTGRINKINEDPQQPREFRLVQNYPNPFNGSTVLQYFTPARGIVIIEIYNILGQKIRTLMSLEQESGKYEKVWDGRDDLGRILNTGVYLIQVNWNGHNQIIPTIYLK
jgi:hypothetical protein